MTTTLTSAGGVSLVSYGTGPNLQIKGLTGGNDTVIVSNTNDLSCRIKTASEIMRFSDDFNQEQDGLTLPLSNVNNLFNILNIWYPEAESANGLGMVQTTPWPGGGGLGVIRFENNVGSNLAEGWNLTAIGAGFNIINNNTEITYEAAVYFDAPSVVAVANYTLEFGLWKNDISANDRFVFNISTTPNSVLSINRNSGTMLASAVTVTSLYNKWSVFKFVRRKSDGLVDVYLDNTMIISGIYIEPGLYFPVIRCSRLNVTSTFNFYFDYVEVIHNTKRR